MKIDPERFNPSYNPAVVHLLNGDDLFVAHQRTTTQGWLWCVLWDGTRRKIPPQRIEHVDTAETTKMKTEGRSWQQIDDDELRTRAKQAIGLDDDRQEVPA